MKSIPALHIDSTNTITYLQYQLTEPKPLEQNILHLSTNIVPHDILSESVSTESCMPLIKFPSSESKLKHSLPLVPRPFPFLFAVPQAAPADPTPLASP